MEKEPTEKPPRPPQKADLITLCAALNAHEVRYLVVGGMAIIQQGFLRATEDIDLLIESSVQNIERVRSALSILPDQAVLEMQPQDLIDYTVVRIADEIIVDLMLKTCGISYAEARDEIEMVEIEGTSIPFASAKLLVRMKNTGREKDALDLTYLQNKLRK